MDLFHISESLGLELRGKYPFSVNMGYSSDIFLIMCFLHETWVKFIFKFAYVNGWELRMPLMSLQFIIQNYEVIICSRVIVIHHL